MTTSANVTRYTILHNGVEVGEHRQHHMCKSFAYKLLQYTPAPEFTLQPHWLDEDEVDHDYPEIGLSEYLQPFYRQGTRFRDGCTIEECYAGPVTQWGYPDCAEIKDEREQS